MNDFEEIMTRYFRKLFQPRAEILLLAKHRDGRVDAVITPFEYDPRINSEITSRSPEWVTQESIDDYSRCFILKDGRTRVSNEQAASRCIHLFAEHSTVVANPVLTPMVGEGEAIKGAVDVRLAGIEGKLDHLTKLLSGDPAALPDHVPVLSQRQYYILQALWELDATSADKRRPTKDIAKRAEGIEADPEGYKQPIAKLAALGFVGTKEGRGGGCWLTAKGIAVTEQLKG